MLELGSRAQLFKANHSAKLDVVSRTHSLSTELSIGEMLQTLKGQNNIKTKKLKNNPQVSILIKINTYKKDEILPNIRRVQARKISAMQKPKILYDF